MASAALQLLTTRLRDIDEILAARDAICSAGAGRPAQRRGAAVIAGGAVLLSALFEGYIEDLFERTLDALHPSVLEPTRNELKKHTSRKNNNANVHQVNTLFFYLGQPWVMSHPDVHWRNCPNARVQQRLAELAKARNQLAHGQTHSVTKPTLRAWRTFIERLAQCLDAIAADRVQTVTGVRPW